MAPDKIRRFKKEVWKHYRLYGRNLPWRTTTNSYRILVSEIMLQQTQVGRVKEKYRVFLRQFPSFRALAAASPGHVLVAWQGLGYNRRALALKRLADIMVTHHRGRLPKDLEVLRSLPGIGAATAGAISAFAFNQPSVFIETNIRRAYIHYFFPHKRRVRDEAIVSLVRAAVDTKRPREWYYALMDYGSHLGKLPENPNKKSARYRLQSTFKGSRRQLRGKIIAHLVGHRRATLKQLEHSLKKSSEEVESVVKILEQEGFITTKQNNVVQLTES